MKPTVTVLDTVVSGCSDHKINFLPHYSICDQSLKYIKVEVYGYYTLEDIEGIERELNVAFVCFYDDTRYLLMRKRHAN